MSFDLFRSVFISSPKSHSRVTDKPIHFLGTNRRYASELFVVRFACCPWFSGGRLGLDAEQAREVLPEDSNPADRN
jgi:hypothetical protein